MELAERTVGGAALGRRLGALDGAALVVSNAVGIGIFTTPALVAGMVSGPAAFLGLWLAGGLLALVGALVYAELGGAYPHAGGEYVYIREAFGPGAAFLSGWTSLMAGFGGAIAAGAVGFAAYLERLVPGLGGERALVALPLGPVALELTPRRILALALIAALAWVHARGLGPGRRVQNALAALSVATIVALVAAGLLLPFPAAAAGPWPGAGDGGGGAFLALVLVMFTYSGWNAAAYLAGEMRTPGRTLHAAVLWGTLLVTGLYLGLNAAYLRTAALGVAGSPVTVADAAAAAVLGRWSGTLVAAVVATALASGVSAMLLAGPRVYLAMAGDGALPPRFGRVHPGTGVPRFGVVAQALWAGVLVLAGAFEALLTYTGFAVVLFSAAAVASLFVLRRRPGYPRHRVVSAWGYPWAPALFLVASAAMVVQAIRFAPGPSLAGTALIVAGVPLHLWRRARARGASRRPRSHADRSGRIGGLERATPALEPIPTRTDPPPRAAASTSAAAPLETLDGDLP